MFKWLRDRPKPQPSKTATPVDAMSLVEVIEWMTALGHKTSFNVLSSGLLRLYEIAFFEHGIYDADREKAAQLIVALKTDLEKQLALDPKKLAGFHAATEYTEGKIRWGGINSLAWIIDEEEVRGGDTIPFIMRPEHGARLAPYLEVIGNNPAMLAGSKPHMVRELVMQRDGRAYPNTVLHLHSLACSSDPATLAVFTADEIAALSQAPYDYGSARSVLVTLGLLSAQSNALPLLPPPEEKLLRFLVSQTALDTVAEPQPFPLESVTPPRDMEGLDVIVPIALCLHLGLTMIESLYGAETRLVAMDGIEIQFSKAADAGLLKLVGMMKNVERLALDKDKNIGDGKFSLDQMMICAAWQESSRWPETEEQGAEIQPYFAFQSVRLKHCRADYLIRFRSYLRFFIHCPADNIVPEATIAEVRQKIADLHVQYGSWTGVIEAASLGEDWIGLSS